ncbi:hypothetical protein GCM10027174_18710 [Salinifilum aidingensis]
MPTAWVLPGGSTFGAIQAGSATALLQAGERPDLLVGTSAGALNAAWLAHDPTERGAKALRRLWTTMRRADVFPVQPLRILAARLGLAHHVMSSSGLLRWLHRNLPYQRIEQTGVPLTITAADLERGTAVYFDRGPVLGPLVASCAIPGMFPPVRFGERWLVDGGVTTFMPVTRAVDLGADRVFVLPCGGAEPFRTGSGDNAGAVATWPVPSTPPRSVAGVNGASLGAAMVAGARSELRYGAERTELYVAPAPSTEGLSRYSFDHSAALIDATWEVVRHWYRRASPVQAGPVDLTGAQPAAGRTDVPSV